MTIQAREIFSLGTTDLLYQNYSDLAKTVRQALLGTIAIGVGTMEFSVRKRVDSTSEFFKLKFIAEEQNGIPKLT